MLECDEDRGLNYKRYLVNQPRTSFTKDMKRFIGSIIVRHSSQEYRSKSSNFEYFIRDESKYVEDYPKDP